MTDIVVKDGRNIPQYEMTFARIDLVANVAVPIPVESESLRIKSSQGNGGTLVYVGYDDVALDANGYELSNGGSITVGGGLGSLIPANTIYVIADANCTIFYFAQN